MKDRCRSTASDCNGQTDNDLVSARVLLGRMEIKVASRHIKATHETVVPSCDRGEVSRISKNRGKVGNGLEKYPVRKLRSSRSRTRLRQQQGNGKCDLDAPAATQVRCLRSGQAS
jgi:hypothetical protein